MTPHPESATGSYPELTDPDQQRQLADFYHHQVEDIAARINNYPEGEARLRAGAYLVLDLVLGQTKSRPDEEEARRQFDIRVAQAILPAAQRRFREVERRQLLPTSAEAAPPAGEDIRFQVAQSPYEELRNLERAGLNQDVYAVAIEALSYVNY